MTTISKEEGDKKMTQSKEIWRKALVLTIVGGLAFWVTNFAISRTPIAAEYRAGLSISYFPMLVEALVGGLIIGFGVSFFLLRFFDKIPTKNPILKSVILSLIALIIATILLEVPSHFLIPNSDPMRYFLMGLLFNVLRILALGIVIGYLYKRLYKGSNPAVVASKSAQVE
jgi:uncharacterized membrane protein